ncbi:MULTISPECIES: type II toxin-antitoxin system VapC family toxin [unclassified Sphingobium]|uniref:type II toxin-antitoxin system VapC family toxin n=1 Tax=unclassified Sphingobium TaxID=2611147 RepID=UPI00222519CD|nr:MULTISPECIES: type II toxin-antitoxin system VapC family toxin [unclassified Sphingobium]MCW2412734.1 putative nucleic acid-binding protein [Sphingobium sp. B8D3D]MCW2414968.1 putative nucleic acid-binding protein [Sphingobium sp. B8D3A]
MSEFYFDTNILIDALHERPQAWAELQRARRPWISRISWIEIMAGAPEGLHAETERFLDLFAIAEVTEEVGRRAASLRQQRGSLKLPDAIILASAQLSGRILVTRNSRDFPANMPGIRIPYTI